MRDWDKIQEKAESPSGDKKWLVMLLSEACCSPAASSPEEPGAFYSGEEPVEEKKVKLKPQKFARSTPCTGRKYAPPKRTRL